jgi:hypothetical protein
MKNKISEYINQKMFDTPFFFKTSAKYRALLSSISLSWRSSVVSVYRYSFGQILIK